MPFYGDPQQFKEAVHSVRAQTDPDWRLVVLNDCYPHWDPDEWLRSLGDPRVVSLRNPENLGVNGSFAKCVTLAEAEYVTILGCDDKLLPGYIASMKALIEKFDSPEYLQPGVEVIDDQGNKSFPLADRVKRWVRPQFNGSAAFQGEPVITSLMHGNWTYFPAICWRADILRQYGFQSGFEIVLDLALQFQILMNNGRFAVTPAIEFQYRRHAASASSYTASDGTRFEEERKFYRLAADQLHGRGWNRASRAAHFRATSRLNAMTKFPSATLRGDVSSAGLLLRHTFSA